MTIADVVFAWLGVGALLAAVLPRVVTGRPLSLPLVFLVARHRRIPMTATGAVSYVGGYRRARSRRPAATRVPSRPGRWAIERPAQGDGTAAGCGA